MFRHPPSIHGQGLKFRRGANFQSSKGGQEVQWSPGGYLIGQGFRGVQCFPQGESRLGGGSLNHVDGFWYFFDPPPPFVDSF